MGLVQQSQQPFRPALMTPREALAPTDTIYVLPIEDNLNRKVKLYRLFVIVNGGLEELTGPLAGRPRREYRDRLWYRVVGAKDVEHGAWILCCQLYADLFDCDCCTFTLKVL